MVDPEKHNVFSGKVVEEMETDNMKFMRDRQVFNPRYFKFMFDLIRVAPTPDLYDDEKSYQINEESNIGLTAIKQATFVCFKFLARAQCKTFIFSKFVAYLIFLYSKNVGACKWLLTYLSKNRELVIDYILGSRDNNVMLYFGNVLLNAMKTLQKYEENDLLKVTKFTQKKKDTETGKDLDETEEILVPNTCTIKFMDLIIELIDVAPTHWYRFSYFFKLFQEFSEISDKYRAYMVNKGLISKFGDFYLGVQSPYLKDYPNKQYPSMGSRLYSPKYGPVIQLISILLRSCHTPATNKRWVMAQSETISDETRKLVLELPEKALPTKDPETGYLTLLSLAERDSKLPHHRLFYTRIIADSHQNGEVLDYTCDIACHWSFEDAQFSEEVAKIVIEGIDRSDLERVRTYLTIMRRLMEIKDTIKIKRFSQLCDCNAPVIDEETGEILQDGPHGQPNFNNGNRQQQYGLSIDILNLIDFYRTDHRNFTYNVIGDLVHIMGGNDEFLDFMISIRERKWGQSWDLFLDDHCHTRYYNYQSPQTRKQKEQFYEYYQDLLKSKGITNLHRLPQVNNNRRNQNNNNGGGGGGGNNAGNNNGGIDVNGAYYGNNAGAGGNGGGGGGGNDDNVNLQDNYFNVQGNGNGGGGLPNPVEEEPGINTGADAALYNDDNDDDGEGGDNEEDSEDVHDDDDAQADDDDENDVDMTPDIAENDENDSDDGNAEAGGVVANDNENENENEQEDANGGDDIEMDEPGDNPQVIVDLPEV